MDERDQRTEARPNVQIVRRVYDAFTRRDIPGVLGALAPDVEITQSSEIPWGGSHTGHDGALQFFAKLTQAITSAVALERLIDAGDHVVAIGRTQGTVNTTGARFDVPIAHVWAFRDGLVVRITFQHRQPDDARRSARLTILDRWAATVAPPRRRGADGAAPSSANTSKRAWNCLLAPPELAGARRLR